MPMIVWLWALFLRFLLAAGTEVVPAGTYVPARPQSGIGIWSDDQKAMLVQSFAKECNAAELDVFAQVCRRKELDPFLGEIVAIKRWDNREGRKVMIIQETVKGLRTIAERSGLYGGFDGPYWCGPDRVWYAEWIDVDPATGRLVPPAAAQYFVRRKDWVDPVRGSASWATSVQLGRDKKPVAIWLERPDEMLGKTAEARALERAFPKEFARLGISTRDLTDAQRVVIEARAVGLDDDGRHALAAQVTNGRTESTRELSPGETLAMRGEIAAMRHEEPVVVSAHPTETMPSRTSDGRLGPTRGAGQGTGEEGSGASPRAAGSASPQRAQPSGGQVHSPTEPDPAPAPTPPVEQDPAEGDEAPRPLATAVGPDDQTATVDTSTGEVLDPDEAEHWRMVNEVLRRVQMLAKAPHPAAYVAYQKWVADAGFDPGKRVQNCSDDELRIILGHFAELDAQAAAETAALEEPF